MSAQEVPGGGAQAQRRTLLVLRSAGDRERLRRIEAELSPRAWDVVQLVPSAREQRRAPAELARERSAAAVLRFDRERDELELWVEGASSGDEGSVDRLPVTGGEQRVLALQVVETLRARVLALEREQAAQLAAALAPEARPGAAPRSDRSEPQASAQDAPPAEAEPAASVPVEEPARPSPEQPAATPAAATGTRPGATERPSVSATPAEPAHASAPAAPTVALELAPAFAYSPGGLDPSVAGWAGSRVPLAGAWSLVGFALVPISRPELAQAEGSARVSTWLFAAALQLRLLQTPIELSLAGGLSGVVLMTHGSARAPFTAHDESAFAPAPFLGPAVHVLLGAGFRAYARAIAGVSLPRLAVRFGARDAARWVARSWPGLWGSSSRWSVCLHVGEP